MALVVAVVLVALYEFSVSKDNLESRYNGLGVVALVNSRKATAPARYRVFVPWLLKMLPERLRVAAYFVAKYALMGASLVASVPLLGLNKTVLLLVLVAVTFEFDYWDCYAELLSVCLCLYGNPVSIVVGGILWGLSKETALLSVPLALFAGGWKAGAIALCSSAVTMVLVRRVQGRAALYSGRWRIRRQRLQAWWRTKRSLADLWLGIAIAVVGPYNPGDLRFALKRRDIKPLVSIVWTLIAVELFLGRGTASVIMSSTSWVGLVWILAGWTLVRARETRVFLPSALWIAAYA